MNERNKRGFTLIELLVVVLIIGLLAAVALPQYNKAVEKTRRTEMITFINTVEKAVDLWLLQNGGFPDTDTLLLGKNVNLLDVDVSNMLGSFNDTHQATSVSGFFGLLSPLLCWRDKYCDFVLETPSTDLMFIRDGEGWYLSCDPSEPFCQQIKKELNQ